MKWCLSSAFFVVVFLRLTLAAPHDFYDETTSDVVRSTSERVGAFPGFPKSYEVEYTFYLPYTNLFSSSPVKYPIHMWVDHEDDNDTRIRVDTYDGLNKKITTKDWVYVINPRIDELMCTKTKPKDDDHHKYTVAKDRGLPHDMGNWTHVGKGVYEDKPCEVYRLTETFFERTAYYTLYVALDGSPLYLSAIGQNYFTGAHFDEYLAYFTNYIPGVPERSIFDPPPECADKWNLYDTGRSGLDRPLVLQLDALIPRIVQGHPEYDAFISNHGRLHSSPLEYEDRLAIFLRNKEHIDRHNMRNDVTYTLELNKYADWTDEEFLSIKTGHLEETEEVEALLEANAEQFVDYTNEDTPANFSWYGTPAVGVVKDQAVCGSCWAFAATEAMQGAWYLATNESLTLSDQQLVDCAWEFYNHACSGGFISTAILFVMANGGIASSFDYPYKGDDQYCNHKAESAAKFATVGLAGRNDPDALKKALVAYGPLGVSMDAGHLDFRFYKSGVFVQPECTNRTNHAVALVGYGNEGGRDYWLLKNSWSTFWGDKGYIKMDAEEFDCGITTRPVYTVANEAAAAKRREELSLRSA